MIDLHTHTLFSDGALIPSEHVRRVEHMGYRAIAITDHADASNLEHLLTNTVRVAAELNQVNRTRLIVGVELTHVPPSQIHALARQARALGAEIVVVHGETPVEPVLPGTNRAALEAGVDILAHPGFLSEEEARLAKANQVALELTARGGHSLTNGHVARVAELAGATLVVNADAHGPGDFLTAEMAQKVALGAGLSQERYLRLRQDMAALAGLG
ncbi:MAG: PHP domain-containing protein [Desulfobulbus propionicus]|nr:MAG: PHP domain-containing protein [Desulfobulbus propionicus]